MEGVVEVLSTAVSKTLVLGLCMLSIKMWSWSCKFVLVYLKLHAIISLY